MISSCANQQVLKDPLGRQSNPLVKQAQTALSEQRFSAAAMLFKQLASTTALPLKNDYLISSANAYTNARLYNEANEIIRLITARSADLLPKQTLLLARLLLNQSKADQAIVVLMNTDESRLTTQQRIDLHTLSSSAFFQAGNLIESARESIALDALITEPQKRINNQTRLLEVLSLLSQQALDFLRPTADPALAGWIDLAKIVSQQPVFEQNSVEIHSWKEQHPSHSANNGVISTLAEQAKTYFKAPNKVGVFLPNSGPFSNPAQSIRKGIMASAYATANRWPININFYDSSSTPIEALYAEAIRDGVDVILGPLDKAKVSQLNAINELPIPVIALNKNGIHQHPDFYQFSLSPEDDVTQVLSLAWLKGNQKVLILTPQSRYGERLASHFSALWQQLGGEILDVQTYAMKKADYSISIKNLLQIDDSIRRFKQLRGRLNLNLTFEERRRHDADFIFLIAAPREGRLIKPQLRFHRASNVAVFSTSKIYEGTLNKVANRDLDGVLFCDIPWLIEKAAEHDGHLDKALKLWPNIPVSHRRLTAFGYDAYQLIPHLDRLKSSDFARLKGKTGILSLNNKGVINRQLSCGQFSRGVVKSLGLAPFLESAINMPPANAVEQAISSTTSPL